MAAGDRLQAFRVRGMAVPLLPQVGNSGSAGLPDYGEGLSHAPQPARSVACISLRMLALE
jgi:hypothetical protein